jgi:hypothetical protein
MELKLQRRCRDEDYTVGFLCVNGVYFCDTPEDADRGVMQSMPPEKIRITVNS